MAEQQASHREDERKRSLELERQQTEYEVQLARRRYESVDPGNRLVAAELEARWNAALARLRDCDARLEAARALPSTKPDRARLMSLAADLEAAWNAAPTAMSTKPRLVRMLIQEIVVDVEHACLTVDHALRVRRGDLGLRPSPLAIGQKLDPGLPRVPAARRSDR